MNRFLSKYFFYMPVTLAKGEAVMAYLPGCRRFQYKSKDEIENYQRVRVLNLLRHAKDHSPFYKERVVDAIAELEKGGGVHAALQLIPFTTKQDLIDNIDEINTYRKILASSKTTGGSTGEPVKLFKNANALARERAATWRSYEWANIFIGDKQARFWGVPHSTTGKLKAQIIDFISNRVRISAFDLTENSLKNYYQQLRRFRSDYLYGYVSVIEALALFIETNQLAPLPSLKAIITTSEVLTPVAKERLERIFQVPVFNEYGCGEVGSIAHQCEHGSMHVMSDNMYVELFSDEGSGGDEGEIVVTDFFNFATPLIRYRLGDYASHGQSPCLCGRTLPVLKGIHGRAYDLIKVAGGKFMHPEAVMYIFEGIQSKSGAFKHFQAVQDAEDHFSINIVPAESWSVATEQIIVEGLRRHVSPELKATFKLVEVIPREMSGKMRVVKSLVN